MTLAASNVDQVIQAVRAIQDPNTSQADRNKFTQVSEKLFIQIFRFLGDRGIKRWAAKQLHLHLVRVGDATGSICCSRGF